MRKKQLLFAFTCFSFALTAQKKPLDHSVYDSWKQIDKTVISGDGSFVSYEINPQKGDGTLYIQNPEGKSILEESRGTNLVFFNNDKYATYSIKPFADSLRMAKLKKVKKDKLPVDTLFFYDIYAQKRTRINPKTEIRTATESPYLFLKHDFTVPRDTAIKNSKNKTFKRLTIRNVETGDSLLIDSIGTFTFDKRANFVLYSVEADSMKSVYVTDFKKRIKLFDSKLGKISGVSLDEYGDQGAFLATSDTAATAVPRLFYFSTAEFSSKKFNPAKYKPIEVEVKEGQGIPLGYGLSTGLRFSKEKKLLHFNYAERPKKKEQDSLLMEEKFSLDLWSTSDTLNMPQQIAGRNRLLNPQYSAVYYPSEKRWVATTNPSYESVTMAAQDGVRYALSIDAKPYMSEMNWKYQYEKDLYLVDLKTGRREEILKEKLLAGVAITPDARHVIFFDLKKQSWFSFSVATREIFEISRGIEFPLYDESNDKPEDPNPYGSFGWTSDFNSVFVYDKYDIWQLDLSGKKSPLCVTGGWGRINNKRLRYVDLSFENYKSVIGAQKEWLLASFDFTTKQNGFYTLIPGTEPVKKLEGPYGYSLRAKSKDGAKLVYSRENYTEFRDLWSDNSKLSSPVKLTNANPQMSDYTWGTVELMKWNDLNGQEVEGLLYKPENYDPTKKYPVIVYFYETHTNDLFRHHHPQPSWSIIIPSMFTSNDYVVFMPDIKYTTGYPGESCYNAVVSGANALIERGIADPSRIGLQGQSWGGYQIAYLVTRTNMFKCASPGAPVSNMTSAYSGIRTGSGMVRMFQYEQGQSRIGVDLWSAPMRYIENSPVFYAPKIETPLLIRHDDADEAVPFEQGVELFMALKRCGKKAWMLNYNNEPHNLRSRPARVDWTIRMHQFFDHYLKDTPAPRWMSEGISIKEKGKDQKYDMTK